EVPRTLALQGADIIVLPTNWPQGAESAPDFITRVRAWENRVFVVATNRVGVERGFRFIGRSQIIAPEGLFMEASPDDEDILYADLNLAEARNKTVVRKPGEWELDITNDRRPELYGQLVR
ncbi:MAG: carbon-nitrogen hydrolase family protein, partial [Candidatus Poribacteria bacterium]|nr:carbon-nitrogen hydrolase family protein [Candidatus Poribacteria bacterium]